MQFYLHSSSQFNRVALREVGWSVSLQNHCTQKRPTAAAATVFARRTRQPPGEPCHNQSGEMLIPHALPPSIDIRQGDRDRRVREVSSGGRGDRPDGRRRGRTDRGRGSVLTPNYYYSDADFGRRERGTNPPPHRPLTTTNRVRVLSPSSWAASFELSRSGCKAAAAFPAMLQPGDILKQSLKLAMERAEGESGVECVCLAQRDESGRASTRV